MVYAKHAAGEDKPLRSIEGNDTGLDAPHGIAVDEKDRLLFVNTWGHHSDFTKAGTGKWYPPAIKVYALDASGDAKPLRVITGDKTQLDWPGGMKFNPDNGDLYIANDIGQSILVFANAPKAQGDVAPARVIHGPSTRLRNPTGVALDRKNGELWVSNLGNSSASVYPLMADGDAAPLARDSQRGREQARSQLREDRGGNVRSHPPGNPGTELSEPTADRGFRQVGERRHPATQVHRRSEVASWAHDA